MVEVRPSQLIDRSAEQELFRSLVAPDSSARMLTICDNGGRGKSSLLRRLRYNCHYEMKPAIPASLIELDRLVDPAPFILVTEMIRTLEIRGERVQDSFAKFQGLDQARARRDVAAFFGTPTGGAGVIGRAMAGRVEGGVNAGIFQGVQAQYAEVHLAGDAFSGDQEQRARQLCVEAFFDDLRAICAVRPLVLLLDGWEKCDVTLRSWILDEMVGNHLLHPNPGLRPEMFALVIAGRPHDVLREPNGLDMEEFAKFFDSPEEKLSTLSSIASLSEWDNDHVREFMTLNGFAEPELDEVHVIRSRLLKGWSLERIRTLLAQMRYEDATG